MLNHHMEGSFPGGHLFMQQTWHKQKETSVTLRFGVVDHSMV